MTSDSKVYYFDIVHGELQFWLFGEPVSSRTDADQQRIADVRRYKNSALSERMHCIHSRLMFVKSAPVSRSALRGRPRYTGISALIRPGRLLITSTQRAVRKECCGV
jgi:hypothetical protein